jgi:membrane glycosyltransferase
LRPNEAEEEDDDCVRALAGCLRPAALERLVAALLAVIVIAAAAARIAAVLGFTPVAGGSPLREDAGDEPEADDAVLGEPLRRENRPVLSLPVREEESSPVNSKVRTTLAIAFCLDTVRVLSGVSTVSASLRVANAARETITETSDSKQCFCSKTGQSSVFMKPAAK